MGDKHERPVKHVQGNRMKTLAQAALFCAQQCLEFHYSIPLILHVPTKTCFKRPIVLHLINTALFVEHWLPVLFFSVPEIRKTLTDYPGS